MLSFSPKYKYIKFKNPKSLEHVTRIFFSNKRKMINKAYRSIFGVNYSVSDNLKLDLKKRPGNINLDDYYKITKNYENL